MTPSSAQPLQPKGFRPARMDDSVATYYQTAINRRYSLFIDANTRSLKVLAICKINYKYANETGGFTALVVLLIGSFCLWDTACLCSAAY
jgi:hypothetical protein